MLIDWFTVIAQGVNFLILVWLMKRFLYKPILNAIDEREKRIAAELANADKKQAEAQQEKDEYKLKNDELDKNRAMLMDNTANEAQAENQRLMAEARQTADALIAKQQEMLVRDAYNMNQSITLLTQQEVFAIARKTLTDLAAASLEERMTGVFISRLQEMDSEAKESLSKAIKSSSEPVYIHSAFNLSAEQREALKNALNNSFSVDINLHFETTPELVSGIELAVNGQKIAWNIADYLASMEQTIMEHIREKEIPEKRIQ
ncbi:MAG: F0F1 ATP synthase subunit B [bacterium]